MTTKEKQQKLIKDLINDYNSTDINVVISALNRTKSKGSAELIPHLIQLFENSELEIKNEVVSIFHSLKTEYAIEPLLDLLKHNNSEVRELVLSAFWNSSLDVSESIEKIVQAAKDGSYMEAVEAYTVIDNLEGPFEEASIIESKLYLTEYFSNYDEKEEKYELMKSIALSIDNYERLIQ